MLGFSYFTCHPKSHQTLIIFCALAFALNPVKYINSIAGKYRCSYGSFLLRSLD